LLHRSQTKPLDVVVVVVVVVLAPAAWEKRKRGEKGTGHSSQRTSKPLALPGSICQCLPNLPLPVSEIPNVRDLSSFCEESYYSVGNR
jgi:hypothetical protein